MWNFAGKMSDYPDPDEEYELMYADELELLKEQEEHTGNAINLVIFNKYYHF